MRGGGGGRGVMSVSTATIFYGEKQRSAAARWLKLTVQFLHFINAHSADNIKRIFNFVFL